MRFDYSDRRIAHLEDCKMTKEFDDRITALDAEIATTRAQLARLERQRDTAVSARAKALADGMTTSGDHIRDLVLRVHHAPDPDIEKRLKAVETKFAGKVGELALFTFCRNVVTLSRRGGPHDSFDRYSDIWFMACGIITGEKLLIESRKIVFPIDRYAVARHSMLADIRFAIADNPFTQKLEIGERESRYALHDYATPERDPYQELLLATGDTEVRTWMDSHRAYKGQFKVCCDLLSKLILEPTDE